MSSQDDRRQYYRIEDRVPMRLTAVVGANVAPDMKQLENEIPSSFKLINTLQEIESEASVNLSSLQGTNPEIVEYLRTLNQRLDLIGGYIAEQEFDKAKNNESVSLSGNGFRLINKESFKIGTILLVEMLLPYKRTGIHCYGKVVECSPEEDGFSIAVTYETIREVDREAIIRHVIRQESKLIRKAKEQATSKD
jgi:hypothetical protein